MGSTKASVLPLPVGAMPTVSFPLRMHGHARLWISVGSPGSDSRDAIFMAADSDDIDIGDGS